MAMPSAPIVTRPLGPRTLVLLDVLAAVAYALLLVLAVRLTPDGTGGRIPEAARIVLVLVIAVPVAARRHWPVAVLVVTGLAAVAALVTGITRDGFIAPALALYILAARGDGVPAWVTRGAVILGIAGLALLVLAGTPGPADPGLDGILVPIVLLAGAWAIGRAVAERRATATRMLEEQVARAIADERLRIARDLHDVVSHGLGLMVVTAANAGHVLAERPEEARQALCTVETTGRAALGEMRHLLDVLRSDPATDAEARNPAPGLRDIPALADRVALAGVPVDLEMDGDDLADGLAVTVFRIVQEALTNVLRHTAATRCTVRVRTTPARVEVEVTDDGRPAAADDDGVARAGLGLIGMRERVRMLGGEFEAGPMHGGGFRVAATIPRTGTA